jgi:hypothetical protein
LRWRLVVRQVGVADTQQQLEALLSHMIER